MAAPPQTISPAAGNCLRQISLTRKNRISLGLDDKTGNTGGGGTLYKNKTQGPNDKMSIVSWNVRGLTGKEEEVDDILVKQNIDFAAISETKKKGQGTQETVNGYIVIQSGVNKDKRASGGVMLYVNKTYKNAITEYNIWGERVVSARIKTKHGHLSIIAVYAPEEGKEEASTDFYESLQKATQRVHPEDDLVIAGDLNAQVGNRKIGKTTGTFGIGDVNSNGKKLIDFCTFNNLRILNTFFRHKASHKLTWEDRGSATAIDYIIAREKTAKGCQDVRTYRGYCIGSDHYLVKGTFKIRQKKNEIRRREKRLNVRAIDDPVNKWLYKKRLEIAEKEHPRSTEVEEEWLNIKGIMKKAAEESLGMVAAERGKNRLRLWDEEMKTLIKEKRIAFRRWMRSKKEEDKSEYNRTAALAKRKARKLKRDSWEKFISYLEHDTYKLRPKVYKILRRMDTNFTERVRLPKVNAAEAVKYFTELWSSSNSNTMEPDSPEEVNEEEEIFTLDELNSVLHKMKNGRAPGDDGVPAELFKYGTTTFKKRLLDLFNLIHQKHQSPSDFRKAVVVPIFKKGDMTNMANYRGISLLCVGYKILAKLLANKLNTIADEFLLESQNGFRGGRSCIDAAYTVKLLMEKRVEFNLETHFCFIDFEKAYDRVEREKLFEILRERKIPSSIIQIIKTMYDGTIIRVRLENEMSEYAEINQGLRQGCPASCVTFNIYIDHILREWYKTQPKGIAIKGKDCLATILFADDQVIMAENEDDLQRAVNNLDIIARRFNMKISTPKTKVMAFIGKDPKRSKIVINGDIIEQVNSFKYLGSELSYMGEIDVGAKINKFLRISGLINRVIAGNNARRDTRIKIYNTFAVPMVKYGCEIWALRKTDKKRITAAEMRFLRRTAGYTLLDRKRNTDILDEIKTTPILRKIRNYRKKWREHVDRMNDDRSPKQIQQYTPTGRRSRGRPRRRMAETSSSSETTPQTGH